MALSPAVSAHATLDRMVQKQKTEIVSTDAINQSQK